MTEVLLSVSEVAKIENCTQRNIRKRIYDSRIKFETVEVKGAHGFEYRIPLSALSPEGKRRYYATQGINGQVSCSNTKYATNIGLMCRDIEELTENQRKQVYLWLNILNEYENLVRGKSKIKTELTKKFVEETKEKYPNLKISVRTLYEKKRRFEKYGKAALADMRLDGNKYSAGRSIPFEVKEDFKNMWLSDKQPTVSAVLNKLESFYSAERPDLLPLPNVSTFRRYIKNIPEPVIEFYRKGNTAFENKSCAYLVRDYENILSNDVWEADYHSCDFWVKDDKSGKQFRPHLIVWIDVRSRKIMSFGLFESSNSYGTVTTFKSAVKRYGIPKKVYLDNGREFLVSDFGGRGRRKKDASVNYGTSILMRLGVKMHNAIPAHGQSKLIERFFKTFKENFSKFIKTYTGGTPTERPESLLKTMENDNNIPLLSKMNELVEAYIEYEYNVTTSYAAGLKGRTPNQCYRDCLFEKRTACEEDLNLLLLRTEKLQTVQRNGVKLTIKGEDIWYYSTELILNWQGKKVFVKYDPESLDTVRVYDENEKYILTAEISKKGGYNFEEGADLEAIKEVNKKRRELKNAVKKYKKSDIASPEATKIIEAIAREKMLTLNNSYNAKVLIPVRCDEDKLDRAVGETTRIDFYEISKKLKGSAED